jgi:Transposase DDE domain
MSSIVDQLTALYTFVDDFLATHPDLLHWRQSPHDRPIFADSEVLTLALLQSCLGVASLKQTYRLVAANYHSAFPHLCSYQQWMARLHTLTGVIGALLQATTQQFNNSAAFYLIDAKPLPVCHPIRHRRVRLLREEGAWFGKTSKGWFFGFKLHVLRHIDGRIVNLVLTPGNWDDRAPALALLEGVEGGVTLGDLGYRGKERVLPAKLHKSL